VSRKTLEHAGVRAYKGHAGNLKGTGAVFSEPLDREEVTALVTGLLVK
jgi:hypothetical protein